jgi:hypothetical protein
MYKKDEIHLLEITNCSNFINCQNTPCQKIVESQSGKTRYLPEPWNGNISTSKILFISSNPSINSNEYYPLDTWENAKVIDFFTNRFITERNYVKNNLYTLQEDMSYSKNWVRYWASVRKIASILLDKAIVSPGIDYTLTEVVRCKSQKEVGVNDALETCVDKFLIQTLEVADPTLIILVGSKAKNIVTNKFNIPELNGRISNIKLFDKNRIVLNIPHPNSREKKSLQDILNLEEINFLKQKLKY